MKLGVDPGLTGALALLDSDYVVKLWDMPVTEKINGKGKQVNAYLLNDIIQEALSLNRGTLIATVEQVGAMPGQGVTSMFGFGRSFGVVEGVLAANGIKTRLIRPAVWKKSCGLAGKEKDASRTKAISLYPEVSAQLCLKKHNGRADAIFLAASAT